jgi:HTH-type transcriptional regulator / antitoxin HigA
MRNQNLNEYSPDSVSPPGETLVDILEARAMSQADLAERTGRPKKTINEIIKGKAMITSETAVQFERVLGVPATFWTTREGHYRAHLATVEEEKELRKHTSWPEHFPLREMQRLTWLAEKPAGVELVRELLTYFGIASPASFDPVYVLAGSRFRQSNKFEIDRYALAAWLRRGELEGSRVDCKPFSRQNFSRALEEIRALTKTGPEVFIPKLKELGREVGVAIVFVHELPRIRTNGATRWLSQDKALIQLSYRGKRNDVLWFTFFHEAGHILLHGKKDIFVDSENRESTDKEEEANAFAGDILLPPRDFQPFVARKDFTRNSIQKFAAAIGVHPGIVVGRLHHDKLLRHPAVHADLFMPLRYEES